MPSKGRKKKKVKYKSPRKAQAGAGEHVVVHTGGRFDLARHVVIEDKKTQEAHRRLRGVRVHVLLVDDDKDSKTDSKCYNAEIDQGYLESWQQSKKRFSSALRIKIFVAVLPKVLVAATTLATSLPKKMLPKKGLILLGELEYLSKRSQSHLAVRKIGERSGDVSDVIIITHRMMLLSLINALCVAFQWNMDELVGFDQKKSHFIFEPQVESQSLALGARKQR